MESKEKLFLTVREFAETIGCSRHLGYEAVRQNKVRYFKIGSRIFIPRKEVDRLENIGIDEDKTE